MKAIIDSGPLIALFDRDDLYPERALTFMKGFRGQLFTTLPVLTEVSHMFRIDVRLQLSFLQWVEWVNLLEITSDDLKTLASLMEIYSDRPMDFADAALVLVAERCGIHQVVSVDNDFDIYRVRGRKKLKNLFPK